MQQTERKPQKEQAWQCRLLRAQHARAGIKTNGGDTVVKIFSLTNESRPSGSAGCRPQDGGTNSCMTCSLGQCASIVLPLHQSNPAGSTFFVRIRGGLKASSMAESRGVTGWWRGRLRCRHQSPSSSQAGCTSAGWLVIVEIGLVSYWKVGVRCIKQQPASNQQGGFGLCGSASRD